MIAERLPPVAARGEAVKGLVVVLVLVGILALPLYLTHLITATDAIRGGAGAVIALLVLGVRALRGRGSEPGGDPRG